MIIRKNIRNENISQRFFLTLSIVNVQFFLSLVLVLYLKLNLVLVYCLKPNVRVYWLKLNMVRVYCLKNKYGQQQFVVRFRSPVCFGISMYLYWDWSLLFNIFGKIIYSKDIDQRKKSNVTYIIIWIFLHIIKKICFF